MKLCEVAKSFITFKVSQISKSKVKPKGQNNLKIVKVFKKPKSFRKFPSFLESQNFKKKSSFEIFLFVVERTFRCSGP